MQSSAEGSSPIENMVPDAHELMQVNEPDTPIEATSPELIEIFQLQAHIATDDETLKKTIITKLTADVLKAKLLHRRLSATHKKKAQLADRFSSCSLSLNN